MRDFTAGTLNTRWCGDITYIELSTRRVFLSRPESGQYAGVVLPA